MFYNYLMYNFILRTNFKRNAFQQSINVIKLKYDEYLLEYNTTFNAICKRYHDKQQQANESDQRNTRHKTSCNAET
ncbi:hypothetical protein T11_10283 [Trichinella zimbabwensis]|uniref:Uncharacterized protein n=1 Tax=Trichinella zimbabwensis TaxID=268475 RepID=A0A0V1I770_9BILA|nr:hypothetical protein T11_10283 [Trichinella zimbabwensis]